MIGHVRGDAAASPRSRPAAGRDAAAVAALIALLFWLYGEPLFLRYYSYDEGNLLLGRPIPIYAALFMLAQYGLFNGRPLSYFLWGVILSYTSTGDGLQGLRWLNFVAGATVAAGLFHLLRRGDIPRPSAFLVVLFVFAQPVLQIYFAVALRLTYWLGIAASLLAFQRYVDAPRIGPRLTASTVALLLVGWTTFQATPFCALAPLALTALTSGDAWGRQRERLVRFLLLFLVTTVAYIAVYALLLHGTEARQYWLTQRFFETLAQPRAIAASGALSPASYLGPFEWWNYIEPLPRLAEATWTRLAGWSAAAVAMTLVAAALLDACRQGVRIAGERHALTWLCVALTFLPLAADGFTQRQNVYIACVPAMAFALAGAARSITRDSPTLARLGLVLAAIVVSYGAVGAKAGFARALIAPSVSFLANVEAQLRTSTVARPERIVVVVVPHECRAEPCRGVHGYRASLGNRRDLGDFYAALAARAGWRSGLPVEFTDDAGIAQTRTDDALVIDLRTPVSTTSDQSSSEAAPVVAEDTHPPT